MLLLYDSSKPTWNIKNKKSRRLSTFLFFYYVAFFFRHYFRALRTSTRYQVGYTRYAPCCDHDIAYPACMWCTVCCIGAHNQRGATTVDLQHSQSQSPPNVQSRHVRYISYYVYVLAHLFSRLKLLLHSVMHDQISKASRAPTR